MNEELNQKISQFLDNELDHDEALSLLQKMQSRSELINAKNRYEAISHALKTDVFLSVDPDFSAKISEAIQREPAYLLPRYKKPVRRASPKLLALAASVAVVAVLATQSMNNPAEHVKTSSILQLAQRPLAEQPVAKQSPTKQSSQSVVNSNKTEPYPLNARINDYLQAHDNSVYTHGEVSPEPMTRVTAYSQE